MEFKIENREILPILTAVGKVINPKSPMAIMRDFLFRCKDGSVTVTATDGEMTIEKTLPVLTVEGEEPFCIDSRWLLNLLRKMGTKVVTIKSSAENVVVSHNSGSYDFPADNPVDFPETFSVDSNGRYAFDATAIADGLNHALVSVSEETIRPVLCGVLIDIAPDCVTFASSDTHILTRYRNNAVRFSPDSSAAHVLPTKAARTLISILPSEGQVDLSMSDRGMRFSGDGFTLVTLVCKGQFPNYNRVIPSTENSTEVVIDRDELKSSLQRLDICTDTQYSRVLMNVDMAGVVLTGNNDEYRVNAKETITADVMGADKRVAYTSDFVTRWLDVANTRLVRINVFDETRPIMLRPSEDKPDTEWLAIVMSLTIVE